MAIRIAVVIAGVTALTHRYTSQVIEEQVLGQLESYAKERSEHEQIIFERTAANQARLVSVLKQRLSQAGSDDPVAQFNERFKRDEDGTLRNRTLEIDGSLEASIHLGPNIQIDADLRRTTLILTDACKQFGEVWSDLYENTYINTPSGLVTTYWPKRPEWSRGIPPNSFTPPRRSLWDTDMEGQASWSPVYLDPSAGWMVTCRTGVFVEGEMVAAVSNDLMLDDLMQRVNEEHLEGGYNMILRNSGTLIAHPTLIDPTHRGQSFNIDRLGDEHLSAMFEQIMAMPEGLVIEHYETTDQYMAVHSLADGNWKFVTVFPGELIAKPALSVARMVLAIGLLSLLIEVLILWHTLRTRIQKPLLEMVAATQQVAQGHLGVPIRTEREDELGKVATSFNLMRDAIQARIEDLNEEIERRRQAELVTAKNQEQLATTLDSIGDAVIATDAQMRITQINPVAAQLTGWSIQEALGLPLSEICRLLDSSTPDATPVALNPLKPHQQLHLLARDGELRRVAAKGAPIQNGGQQDSGCVLVFRDITEEYELRENLNQSHKLEAIGQLAGGVAHDFNNLLTGIMGSVDLLLDDTLSRSSRELATNILDASNQARDLTRQLLDFGRKGRASTKQIEVHPVLDEVVSTLTPFLPADTELSLHLDAPCSMIRGDKEQLKNALLNLGSNARDAIQKSSPDKQANACIEIRTYNRLLGSSACANLGPGVSPGEHLEICIRDTGIGMSLATKARIFEPFFTTKDGGRGPGLGLAGVYGCVRSHGGGIRVESLEGEGTSVHLFLPTIQGAHELKETTLQPFTRRQGHILLVDDEAIILKMTKLVLERHGYTVTTCCDGFEAVEYFTQNHGQVDLALMDLVMPRLSGVDAFKRMHEIDPSVPVVLTSGYTSDRSEEDLMAMGPVGFLPKPYGVRELLAMMSTALSGCTEPGQSEGSPVAR